MRVHTVLPEGIAFGGQENSAHQRDRWPIADAAMLRDVLHQLGQDGLAQRPRSDCDKPRSSKAAETAKNDSDSRSWAAGIGSSHRNGNTRRGR